MTENNALPYLNLGCGNVLLPSPRPMHHQLIPPGVHEYPYWLNVDKDPVDGVLQADVFRYPFPWADNSFGGALLTHLIEHIPHEYQQSQRIDNHPQYPDSKEGDSRWFGRSAYLRGLGDGFYAFFSELNRVLANGALVHIIVPYAFSTGAFQDPTHRRFMTPDSFGYLIKNPNAPFQLPDVGGWQINDSFQFAMSESAARDFATFQLMSKNEPDADQRIAEFFNSNVMTHMNFASEFYVQLEVVK